MIETPTTFVLGAGASASYGFPTAPALTRRIIDRLTEESGGLFGDLVRMGHSPDGLRSFRVALRESRIQSIDRFLEIRQDDANLVEMGKRAIAYVLIENENTDRHWNNSDDDWMGLIWNAMAAARIDDLRLGHVSFVTFNYDRSLEEHLVGAVKHTYGVTDKRAEETVNRIPIVHVYGVLGRRPGVASYHADRVPERPYAPQTDPEIVKLAAGEIRLIGERRDAQSLVAARQLIDASKRVVFLGFGYDRINVERLFKPSEWTYRVDTMGIRLQGSAYGLRQAEFAAAHQLCAARLHLGNPDWRCLEFLRHHVDLGG